MKKITLLCIGILVFLVSFNSVLGSWADDNLGYCKNIEINNTDNGDTLTDYQILLHISNETEMNNDYSDLRFYNIECNNSGSKLDYWIRNYSDTQADIWVEVDSIPNNTYHNISMYYGNASYTSESNGTETFIIFHDFEDGSVGVNADNWYGVNGWTTGETWEIATDGTNKFIEVKGVSPAGNGGAIFYNGTDVLGEKNNVTETPYIIEGVFNNTKQRFNLLTENNGYDSGRDGYNTAYYQTSGLLRRVVSDSFNTLDSTNFQIPANVWNTFNYTRYNTPTSNIITLVINQTQVYNLTDANTQLEENYLLGFQIENGDTQNVDNITIRSWASNVPSYNVGAEEEQTTTTTTTIPTTTTSTTIPLFLGNYTTYSCNGEWLVKNVTNYYGNDTDNTTESVLSYEKCDYNCSETILGIRCDYSPFIRNGMIIGIFILVLLAFVVIYNLMRRLL